MGISAGLKISSIIGVGICALLGGAVAPANASVLTFSSDTSAFWLPDTYGDRIGSQAAPSGWSYGGAENTPNVEMSYTTIPAGIDFAVYGTGYGNLDRGLGHGPYDVDSLLTFTPDANWYVKLDSFEIASWSAGAPYDTIINLSDDNGLVWSWSGSVPYVDGSGNPTHLTFTPNAWGVVGALKLSINNLGSTGLDNIHFSQGLSPVPLPAAAWLFGSALLGLGWARRFRRQSREALIA